MVIRTPDQRLRVFVSSTLGELAAERRAVARAITPLRQTSACGRGRCNSRGKPSLTQIRQALGADRFDQDFAAGVRLNRQQAIAAVRLAQTSPAELPP